MKKQPYNQTMFRNRVTIVLRKFNLYSPAAVELLLGTAAVESDFGKNAGRQIGGGPARGVFQIEPFTHKDIWDRYIKPRPLFQIRLRKELDIYGFSNDNLDNDFYAIIIARLKYYLIPKPLPAADDIEGLALYWKRWYNSYLGDGSVIGFIEKYNRYVVEPREVEGETN